MITNDIQLAANRLNDNEVVAIPTETVYGLAANAYSETAVKKIFLLKNRPLNNPLIVHIKSFDYLRKIATDIPEAAIQLASKYWPGPLTLVLKKQAHISDIVTAGKDTVAVRIPNHPLCLALLEKLDFPIAAPSANPFGLISPTTAEHVHHYFNDAIDIILDGGQCEKGIESTIIGFKNKQAVLYRHGSISVEDIERVIGKLIINTENEISPEAPGMLSKHYAPLTKTILTNDVNEVSKKYSGKRIGLLLFAKKILGTDAIHQEILSSESKLEQATSNLYAALHRLDSYKLDVIIAERFPDIGLGKTINDRLQRATT